MKLGQTKGGKYIVKAGEAIHEKLKNFIKLE